MNDFIKNLISKVTETWKAWTIVQKGIFGGIVAVVILGVIIVSVISARPDKITVFSSPVKDSEAFDRIVNRLEEDQITFEVNQAGDNIFVNDKRTEKKIATIIATEQLFPKNMNWSHLNTSKFFISELEQKEKNRLALSRDIEQHLESIEDIANAEVIIAIPKKEYFTDNQSPVTASVILTVKPYSDFVTSKKKIQGVENLILSAIPEIKKDNIKITDKSGVILNGDVDDGFEKLQLTNQQLKIKEKFEKLLFEKVQKVLLNGGSGGPIPMDRISISPVTVDIQFDEESYLYDEILPIVLAEDNPDTPYSEREVIEKVLVESVINNEVYQGTGFNPEGPPGVEGQVPPAYKDLEGLVGKYNKDQAESRFDTNKKKSNVKKTPWQVKGISVSVMIDGIWEKMYDKNGKVIPSETGGISRQYTEVDTKTLAKIRGIVEGSINYNKNRGDIVRVENIEFDRSAQFEKEDASYRNIKKVRLAIIYTLIGLFVLFLMILAIRSVVRFRQALQKKRDQELLAKAKRDRELAVRQAENLAVPISGADQKRQQIIDEALSMARNSPEDVANLIRTWLVED